MGPVRHRQLIRALACVVALDLTAGVVVLSTRGPSGAGDGNGRESRAAGRVEANPAQDGILAGGQFTNRRGSGRGSTSSTSIVTSPAPASTTAPTTGGSTTSASGPRATSTTRPATSSTRAPATTTTSRPATTTTGASGQDGAPGASGQPGTDGSPGAAGTPATGAPGATTAAFDDKKADTVAQSSGKAKPEPRADIMAAHVSYETGKIVFAVRVGQWVDPRQDPNWASDSTYLSWEIDTDGDGKPDYEVQYFLSEGTPVAGVSRVGDEAGDSVCDSEAGFAADGYAVAIDPACFNGPASFSYRVTMNYDSDPKNEDADVITDTAPDGGLSHPVARPA